MADFTATYLTPNLLASGNTWSNLQASGFVGALKAIIEANSTPIAPTLAAPTFAATGGGSTGGSLPAGTYFGVYTETNGIGETVKSSESTQLTVAAGNIPRATFPALTSGLNGINFYLTPKNGASGTEVIYATGITTTTFDMSSASYAGSATPPTANTTALGGGTLKLLNDLIGLGLGGNGPRLLFLHLNDLFSNFLDGRPIAFDYERGELLQMAVAFKAILQAVEESATLINANAGTLSTKPFLFQQSTTRRLWP
jgi:hypothetical protein